MIGKVLHSGNFRRMLRIDAMPVGGVEMERRGLRSVSKVAGGRVRDALASRLARHSRLHVPAADEPETIMAVTFEGLSEREMEAALAAFPGGKRFVLQG